MYKNWRRPRGWCRKIMPERVRTGLLIPGRHVLTLLGRGHGCHRCAGRGGRRGRGRGHRRLIGRHRFVPRHHGVHDEHEHLHRNRVRSPVSYESTGWRSNCTGKRSRSKRPSRAPCMRPSTRSHQNDAEDAKVEEDEGHLRLVMLKVLLEEVVHLVDSL